MCRNEKFLTWYEDWLYKCDKNGYESNMWFDEFPTRKGIVEPVWG